MKTLFQFQKAGRPGSIILQLAALFLMLTSLGCGPKLNHFLCYQSTPGLFEGRVDLKDQFGYLPNVPVEGPIAFCNPVQKTHDGKTFKILDESHHLTAYTIDGVDQKVRDVEVSNQFIKGKKVIKVKDPKWLLVPTRKIYPRRHEEPQRLDHFICYDIIDGEDLAIDVDLKDQFGFWPEANVGKAMALCNPVEKTYNGKRTPRQNPKDHLICYGLDLPFYGPVKGNNQFHPFSTELNRIFGLCVPTKKKLLPEKKERY